MLNWIKSVHETVEQEAQLAQTGRGRIEFERWILHFWKVCDEYSEPCDQGDGRRRLAMGWSHMPGWKQEWLPMDLLYPPRNLSIKD